MHERGDEMFEDVNVELYVVGAIVVSGLLWWALTKLFPDQEK